MLFYVLGEMMSLLIGKLIPGSVCGMILFFIPPTLKWIRPHDVDKAASALTRNMALFFVPASIGLMHEYKNTHEQLGSITHRIGCDNIAGNRCRRSNRRTARPQIIP